MAEKDILNKKLKTRTIQELEIYKTDDTFVLSADVIDFVINSLKVDKACQLEYEKVEPRWIPINEKLPNPLTFVNVTCRSLIDDREDWVVETIYAPIPKEYNPKGYSDWGNIPMLNWKEAEVIAWMERIIPEPYRS